MARTSRQGVSYFPLDVHLDTKFKILEAKHGLSGFAVAIKLMQSIYAEGYWLKFDEDDRFLFANENRLNLEELDEILNTCMEKEIFSIDKYRKHKILTSRGIQRQYKEMTKRRKDVEIIDDYLIDVNIMSTSCQHHVNISEVTDRKKRAEVDLQNGNSKHDAYKSTQTETERETETETEKETDTETLKTIGKKWEECGHGMLDSHVATKLLADTEIFSSAWVLEAIEKASEYNKHNYAYIRGILNKWKTEGKSENKAEPKKRAIKYFEPPSEEEEARIKAEADKARELMKGEFAKLRNGSYFSDTKQ